MPTRLRVLVADDSPLFRARLRDLFMEFDSVEWLGLFSNGRELMAELESVAPDLLILDLMMPEMGGFEVLLELRRGRKAGTVVVLSHFDSPLCRSQCLGAGADYVFSKSREFDRLREIVESISRRRGLGETTAGNESAKPGP